MYAVAPYWKYVFIKEVVGGDSLVGEGVATLPRKMPTSILSLRPREQHGVELCLCSGSSTYCANEPLTWVTLIQVVILAVPEWQPLQGANSFTKLVEVLQLFKTRSSQAICRRAIVTILLL